ncbi:non-hydrolyzing UDP-N-acetylglucosamine 2-epimerase [Arachidicoccus terrestris]|uniref:non-hydrolyzing UDP-N-acetylglucosamine 2-epimerase n=1 Tax=Arachidicoccus terrestris TaxID=2875539 RepID=UPI001CC348B2|nr:UDP-N-acetylglucosamine 2-epimerase (non-hydrolyzing) [Arachidicoccus terrestris]UAY55457.1 UDP-N-acetylglucosamine 2-epimerase (non-hydrolyzing) [Arachidicoccus terrestris]
MRVTLVAGARPNFMKIAPIVHAITKFSNSGHNISFRLVHTGQHYDKIMSDVFFEQLGIPKPNSNLNAGSGSQAEQTAAIMIRFEKELIENPTDLVVVVGDVTSTMACAIVAQKLHVKVAHVEAGIRSGDWSMPEEINRLVTDSITNYYFTTSMLANSNLLKAGVDQKNIFFVGNTMIDTLLKQMPFFKKPKVWSELRLCQKQYLVITLHRPANVDSEGQLKKLLSTIVSSSNDIPLIFPVHPRTAKKIALTGIFADNLHMIAPLSYLEFNYLVRNSKAIITDSGGITEEATVMGIPCMTLRDSTERPETCTIGTNELLGTDPTSIPPAFEVLFAGKWKKGSIPEKWDGKAAERIVESLLSL